MASLSRRIKTGLYDTVTALGAGLLSPFSPGRAGLYRYSRNQYRTYVAGELTGPNQNYRPRNRSADADIRRAEKWVTARTRDQVQNNPLISGGIDVICYNVVRHGIMPEFQLVNTGGELLTEVNAEYQRLFNRWQRHADSTGHGWYCDIQKLILRHLWMDGQCLVRRTYDTSLPGVVPLRLEVLECDHLDKSVDGRLQNGNVARRGIELDPASGRPVAYHLLSEHPGDGGGIGGESNRYPAKDILHIYERRRASQFSGISWLAAVVMEAYRMDDYRVYEQDGARTAAAFVAFAHTAYPSMMQPGGGLPAGGQAGPVTTGSQAEDRPTEVVQNQITYLPHGNQITLASHNRPGNNFEPFVKDSKKTQAAGLTMSYESLSRDHTDASYASARSGSLEERLSFQNQQGLLTRREGSPVVAWFMEAAFLSGLAPAVLGYTADPQKFHEMHTHQEPGWTWVDPKNDALAAKTAREEVLDSRTSLAAQRGKNFAMILKQQIQEERDLQELYTLRRENEALAAENHLEEVENDD